MIDTAHIREKILDLAIQGKLVDQDPAEGQASELLAEIQVEKERLIKEKKIRKEKALPQIREEEIPFDLPESWEWVRLGDIIDLKSGIDLHSSKFNTDSKGIPYVTGASNIENGNIIINRWTSSPTRIADPLDILLTCKGTVGKIAITQTECHIARQIMAIKNYSNVITDYLIITLKNYTESLKSIASGLIPGITRGDVLNIITPLPPLAEQKRIVAKIEEVFALLDEIDQAQKELLDLADTLKAKVLDLAMRGELVDQDPSEGNASELLAKIQAEKERLVKEKKIKKQKSLPQIRDEEIPFDIPESWEWVRLGEVTNYGNNIQVKPELIKSNSFLIDLEDIEKFTNKLLPCDKNRIIKSSKNKFSSGDVLYGKLRPYLKKCIIPEFDGYCSTEIMPFIGYANIHSSYIMHFMMSPFINDIIDKITYGVNLPRLGTKDARNLPFPLPPLAEQKRIVAKIEEIFAAIDAMVQQKAS